MATTYDEKLVDGKALDQLAVGIYEKLKTKIDEKPNTTVTGGKGVTVSKSGDDYTINVSSANDGITVNDNNIQLNVVNDVTSGGIDKPLSAEQGKILKQSIDGKEPKITAKKTGFNLDKSDAVDSNVSTTLATSAAVKKAYDKGVEALNNANNKLVKGGLPATIPDGKTIYDLLENNGGINIDTALLYLNDVGTKTAGKVYFDKNKKGLFECIKTTTNTVNSTEFFVDISNKASADRLTNLISFVSNDTSQGIIFNNLKIMCGTMPAVTDGGKIYFPKSFTNPPTVLVNTDMAIGYSDNITTCVHQIFKDYFIVAHNYAHPQNIFWIAVGE